MILVIPLIPLAFLLGFRLAKRKPRSEVKRQGRLIEFENREVKNFLTYDGTEQE